MYVKTSTSFPQATRDFSDLIVDYSWDKDVSPEKRLYVKSKIGGAGNLDIEFLVQDNNGLLNTTKTTNGRIFNLKYNQHTFEMEYQKRCSTKNLVEFAIKSAQLVMLNHYCCRLVNDHILLQGSMTSSIPDMKRVNGLIDLSNKYQEDGANKIDAKVLILFSTRCRVHFSII